MPANTSIRNDAGVDSTIGQEIDSFLTQENFKIEMAKQRRNAVESHIVLNYKSFLGIFFGFLPFLPKFISIKFSRNKGAKRNLQMTYTSHTVKLKHIETLTGTLL